MGRVIYNGASSGNEAVDNKSAYAADVRRNLKPPYRGFPFGLLIIGIITVSLFIFSMYGFFYDDSRYGEHVGLVKHGDYLIDGIVYQIDREFDGTNMIDVPRYHLSSGGTVLYESYLSDEHAREYIGTTRRAPVDTATGLGVSDSGVRMRYFYSLWFSVIFCSLTVTGLYFRFVRKI